MANTKISALTSASTPLAGTETLPIVQSSATVKVAVSNLTAGRAVSAASLTLTTTPLPVTSGGTGVTTSTGTGNTVLSAAPTLSGDVTLSTGNLVIGTAAKGINFTANTPAAGMTSQLLNWYEEGTWTPVATSITIVSGTPVWSGKYTRIGRQVIATWKLAGGANVNVSTSSYLSLPFTSSEIAWGSYGNNSTNAFIGGMATFSASLYFGTAAVGLGSAGGTIVFQV